LLTLVGHLPGGRSDSPSSNSTRPGMFGFFAESREGPWNDAADNIETGGELDCLTNGCETSRFGEYYVSLAGCYSARDPVGSLPPRKPLTHLVDFNLTGMDQKETLQTLLTRAELATRWGTTLNLLRAKERRGELEQVRLGPKSIRYRLSDILAIEGKTSNK